MATLQDAIQSRIDGQAGEAHLLCPRPGCGNTEPVGSAFCRKCGTATPPQPTVQPSGTSELEVTFGTASMDCSFGSPERSVGTCSDRVTPELAAILERRRLLCDEAEDAGDGDLGSLAKISPDHSLQLLRFQERMISELQGSLGQKDRINKELQAAKEELEKRVITLQAGADADLAAKDVLLRRVFEADQRAAQCQAGSTVRAQEFQEHGTQLEKMYQQAVANASALQQVCDELAGKVDEQQQQIEELQQMLKLKASAASSSATQAAFNQEVRQLQQKLAEAQARMVHAEQEASRNAMLAGPDAEVNAALNAKVDELQHLMAAKVAEMQCALGASDLRATVAEDSLAEAVLSAAKAASGSPRTEANTSSVLNARVEMLQEQLATADQRADRAEEALTASQMRVVMCGEEIAAMELRTKRAEEALATSVPGEEIAAMELRTKCAEEALATSVSGEEIAALKLRAQRAEEALATSAFRVQSVEEALAVSVCRAQRAEEALIAAESRAAPAVPPIRMPEVTGALPTAMKVDSLPSGVSSGPTGASREPMHMAERTPPEMVSAPASIAPKCFSRETTGLEEEKDLMQQEVVRQCEEILKLTKEQSILRQQLEEGREVLGASERQNLLHSGRASPTLPVTFGQQLAPAVPPVAIVQARTPSPPLMHTASPIPYLQPAIITTGTVPTSAAMERLNSELQAEMPNSARTQDSEKPRSTPRSVRSTVITTPASPAQDFRGTPVHSAPVCIEPVAQLRRTMSPVVIRSQVTQVVSAPTQYQVTKLPFASSGLAVTPPREASPVLVRERPSVDDDLPPYGSKVIRSLTGDVPAPTPEPTEDGMSSAPASARGLPVGPYADLFADTRVAAGLPFGVRPTPTRYMEPRAAAPVPLGILNAEPRAVTPVAGQRFYMRPRSVPSAIYEVREPSSSPYRSRSPKAP